MTVAAVEAQSGTQQAPHDLDAEATVLSAVLLMPEVLSDIGGMIAARDFYAHANRDIWTAILELETEGRRIDPLSVAGRLKDRGVLVQAGGSAYIAQITDATPATCNFEDHAKRVASLAAQRRIADVAGIVRTEALAPVRNWATWCDSVEARLLDATARREQRESQVTLKEAVKKHLARKGEELSPGIMTGLAAWDRKTLGLRRGTFNVLAGRPGMGKTSLAWKMANGVAAQGIGVVFIEQEMPNEHTTSRAIAMASGVDTARVETNTLTQSEWNRISDAARRLEKLPIVIDDMGGQSLASIRRNTRRAAATLRREHGAELGLLVVDYLQIMSTAGTDAATRDAELGAVTRGLLALGRELNVAVLALSQLNRKCESRPDKRPQLSDLRESGAIEQDAFSVTFVYREAVYTKGADERAAELIIAKLRQGGGGGTVPVKWDGPTCTFSDYDEPNEDDMGIPYGF